MNSVALFSCLRQFCRNAFQFTPWLRNVTQVSLHTRCCSLYHYLNHSVVGEKMSFFLVTCINYVLTDVDWWQKIKSTKDNVSFIYHFSFLDKKPLFPFGFFSFFSAKKKKDYKSLDHIIGFIHDFISIVLVLNDISDQSRISGRI